MDTTSAIILAVIVLAIAIAIVLFLRTRRTDRLRQKFRTDNRAIEESGGRGKAERELEQRQKQIETFSIRPLTASDRRTGATRWRGVQSLFVGDPQAAVGQADKLVERGDGNPRLPGRRRFEQRSADLSVDHPAVVQNYRAARYRGAPRNKATQGFEETLPGRHDPLPGLFVELGRRRPNQRRRAASWARTKPTTHPSPRGTAATQADEPTEGHASGRTLATSAIAEAGKPRGGAAVGNPDLRRGRFFGGRPGEMPTQPRRCFPATKPRICTPAGTPSRPASSTSRQVVEQADELVATTMKRLEEIFAAERDKLEQQWARGDVSTEDLRVALRRYRSLASRASRACKTSTVRRGSLRPSLIGLKTTVPRRKRYGPQSAVRTRRKSANRGTREAKAASDSGAGADHRRVGRRSQRHRHLFAGRGAVLATRSSWTLLFSWPLMCAIKDQRPHRPGHRPARHRRQSQTALPGSRWSTC